MTGGRRGGQRGCSGEAVATGAWDGPLHVRLKTQLSLFTSDHAFSVL